MTGSSSDDSPAADRSESVTEVSCRARSPNWPSQPRPGALFHCVSPVTVVQGNLERNGAITQGSDVGGACNLNPHCLCSARAGRFTALRHTDGPCPIPCWGIVQR